MTGFTGSRVTTMQLSRLPARSTIEVRCTAPKSRRGTGRVANACPFKKLTLKNTKTNGRRSLAAVFRRHLMPVGTIVEVRVRRTNYVGQLVRFQMRRGRTPVRTTTCLNSKKATPQKC